MKLTYRSTVLACYNGYITQAICINLAPLLYLTFQKEYALSATELGMLVAVNFIVQILVDVLASAFSKHVNLRFCAVLAHVLTVLGLFGLSLLPQLMPPYLGLLLAEALLGSGGGFTEVIISPVLEACPTDEKSGNMSLLHSFYCWGQAGVVLLSGVFFFFFEISAFWKILPMLWAIIPAVGAVAFSIVPLYRLPGDQAEGGAPLKKLFQRPIFFLFLVMMMCAGAGEMIMSQWASAFVESALGIEKSLGDLLGPCMFALMMGTARVLYGRFSERVDLTVWMMFGCVGCIGAYLLAAFASNPYVALIGCALCGLSVGVFWPGTLSCASEAMPMAGMSLFAILAVAGDVGCLTGPSLSGVIADACGGDLRPAFCFATLFPAICLAALLFRRLKKRNQKGN